MRDWIFGTEDWKSVAVKSTGKIYGIPTDLFFSLPCTFLDGKFRTVNDISLDDLWFTSINATTKELIEER